jgi:hypothetical protein
MKFATQIPTLRHLTSLAACATLVACGGGGSTGASSDSAAQTAGSITSVKTGTTTGSTGSTNSSGASTTTPGQVAGAAAITDIRIQNTDTVNAQTNTPFTFGQVFVAGQLKPTEVIAGRLEDGSAVSLQMDVKATHPDGSVRHAVISGILPSVAAGAERTVTLVKGGTAPTATVAVSAITGTGFNPTFHAKIGGVDYYAAAGDLLKAATPTTWLKGGVVNEWQVAAPLHTADGKVHPHLSARFAIRWYDAIKKARVDVTVENDWAYEPSPQNFTYDASVVSGATTVYSKAALTHLHHTRWRKIFWYNGSEPSITIKHNTAYLISTRAVPNYDQTLKFPESAFASLQNRWASANKEPMGTGLTTAYMPMTGGRDDIGLLPLWSATYLLSQDSRAKEIMLRTADLAGSFSAHYRDKNTGRPVSLADYPYMTILGRSTDTMNPATRKYESFPECGGDCNTPNTHDSSHQPAMVYLPYLVTGDYYYLEELQFWGMWDAFSSNPGYRENIKGLLQSDQVRGQAWSLRTLSEVAYITPDNDAMKATFNTILTNNLDWYNATYTNNASANKLGAIVNGYALVYNNETGLAPWQDDFFTSAVGHASDLGFDKATTLLAWKAKFPVDRMVGSGACWVDGAIYQMTVRASNTSAYYGSIGEAYRASHDSVFQALACGTSAMATALGLKVGEMTGFSSSVVGYPSNMQPALAYAAGAAGTSGKSAWNQFLARSVKPDYTSGPQFAIVPR